MCLFVQWILVELFFFATQVEKVIVHFDRIIVNIYADLFTAIVNINCIIFFNFDVIYFLKCISYSKHFKKLHYKNTGNRARIFYYLTIE